VKVNQLVATSLHTPPHHVLISSGTQNEGCRAISTSSRICFENRILSNPGYSSGRILGQQCKLYFLALQLEIADGLGTPLQRQCPGSVGAKSNVLSSRTRARFMLVKSEFKPNLRATVELMDRADHTSIHPDATMQSRCMMSQQARTRR
jgi:hypothetical protein